MNAATGDSRSITVSASPQALFATLCDVRSLSHWWGPDGFSSTVHEFSLTPGARWLLTLHGPDGATYPIEYRVMEVEQDRLLVLDHPSADHHFVLRLSLLPRGDTTEVHLQQSFDNAQVAQKQAGIRACLQQAMDCAQQGILPVQEARDIVLPEAFHNLTPGRQRSYVLHLEAAKKTATRNARILACRERILAGKGAQEY